MLPSYIKGFTYDWSPNYDKGRSGHQIKRIIIHDTEGGSSEEGYQGSVGWLASPYSHVSAHYVINGDGTEVTQEVADPDTAWHCGNLLWNWESIGIEHAGKISEHFYSDGLYRTSAKIAAYLCYSYSMLPTREVIKGHIEVPDQLQPAHTDPGPSWDWNKYMGMVREEYARILSNQNINSVNPDPNVWVCKETNKEVNNVYGFYKFWQTKGGLEIFGLPITGAYGIPPSQGRPDMVIQYFERSRFEYHLDDKKIYLGHLGVEALAK